MDEGEADAGDVPAWNAGSFVSSVAVVTVATAAPAVLSFSHIPTLGLSLPTFVGRLVPGTIVGAPTSLAVKPGFNCSPVRNPVFTA